MSQRSALKNGLMKSSLTWVSLYCPLRYASILRPKFSTSVRTVCGAGMVLRFQVGSWFDGLVRPQYDTSFRVALYDPIVHPNNPSLARRRKPPSTRCARRCLQARSDRPMQSINGALITSKMFIRLTPKRCKPRLKQHNYLPATATVLHKITQSLGAFLHRVTLI